VKAMILAAGKGERMRPLTLHTPKPLLRVGGKSLIDYHLKNLSKAGFADIIINHAWLGEQIEQQLGSGEQLGLKIHYSREGEPLETAGGIVRALHLLADETSPWFLVINGDIWCDFDFTRLQPPTSESDRALIVLADNPEHNPAGDFALAGNGRLTNQGTNRLTYTGISLLHRDLFTELSDTAGKLAPVLRAAAERSQVTGLHHTGQWVDVGTPERLARLDQKLSGRQPEA